MEKRVLKPLSQWICDTCSQVIADPKHGFIEWLEGDDRKAHSFRIVHNGPWSPNRNTREGCLHYGGHRDRKDQHLEYFVGDMALPRLLPFLDPGPLVDPEGDRIPGVRSMREFVELLKRLTLPYYEQARGYLPQAVADGDLGGSNEIALNTPDILRRVVEEHESR